MAARTLEKTLARRLRQLAAQRDLPLSHLADRCGIARSHLWAVLGAERSATLGLVQRLADVLGVDPLTLLGTGEPPNTPRASPKAGTRRPSTK